MFSSPLRVAAVESVGITMLPKSPKCTLSVLLPEIRQERYCPAPPTNLGGGLPFLQMYEPSMYTSLLSQLSQNGANDGTYNFSSINTPAMWSDGETCLLSPKDACDIRPDPFVTFDRAPGTAKAPSWPKRPTAFESTGLLQHSFLTKDQVRCLSASHMPHSNIVHGHDPNSRR